MENRPWLHIPDFAEPGQAQAFADREDLLARLYTDLVQAGNAVRAGQSGVRYRHVVDGYMGAGKSSLILQALRLIREGPASMSGQVPVPPDDLLEPLDRQRWLIFRFSGKHIANAGELSAAVRRMAADQGSEEPTLLENPFLSFFEEFPQQAYQQVDRAVELPVLHRLLRTREAQLYKRVKSALLAMSLTLDFVKRWYGAVFNEKREKTSKTEQSADLELQLETMLEAQGALPATGEGKAALKMAANIVHRVSFTSESQTEVAHQWRVDAEMVVEAFNGFFKAAETAGLPTVLVLDDFDEFASSAGPSQNARFEVLSRLLGPFNRMAPTCLILGLRQEYMHEDIRRQYQRSYVPPLACKESDRLLEAWAQVQQPPLVGDDLALLKRLGRPVVGGFGPEQRVILPFRFLRVVTWLWNGGHTPDASPSDLLHRYAERELPPDALRAVVRIAAEMSRADILDCAQGQPLNGDALTLSPRERLALQREGLLRPAMAGDLEDTRVVLDPFVAWLAQAQP